MMWSAKLEIFALKDTVDLLLRRIPPVAPVRQVEPIYIVVMMESVNMEKIVLKDTVELLLQHIHPAAPALQLEPIYIAIMMESASMVKIALKGVAGTVTHAMAFVATMQFVNQHTEENIEAFLQPVDCSVHNNSLKVHVRAHLVMKVILMLAAFR